MGELTEVKRQRGLGCRSRFSSSGHHWDDGVHRVRLPARLKTQHYRMLLRGGKGVNG